MDHLQVCLPDTIKRERKYAHTAPWHYYDIPYNYVFIWIIHVVDISLCTFFTHGCVGRNHLLCSSKGIEYLRNVLESPREGRRPFVSASPLGRFDAASSCHGTCV